MEKIMKLFFIALLTSILSSNVLAESISFGASDKQVCSLESEHLDSKSSVFVPNSKYKLVNLSCGFKPFKPLGCQNGYAVCSCDSNGNCQWIWMGCS